MEKKCVGGYFTQSWGLWNKWCGQVWCLCTTVLKVYVDY